MLYELLAGELPFTTKELHVAGQRAALDLIRDSEPPRPSSKLTSLGNRSTEVARLRQTSIDGLARELRGDLDWVVMKAMAKEPERRYDAASALGEELGRHLRHEPVVEGPPSLRYRLRKFGRRYRAQLVATGDGVVCARSGARGNDMVRARGGRA